MQTLKYLAFSTILAGVFALPLAGAHAEGKKASAAGTSAQSFKTLDTDSNGVLSESEYDAQASANHPAFSEVDKNGDGSLTISELQMKDKAPGNASRTGGNSTSRSN